MLNLDDLIARIRDAGGPDPKLDHDILLGLGARYEQDWGPEYYLLDGSRFYPHALTASVDAALALARHLLPDWGRSVDATVPELGIDVEFHHPRPSEITPKAFGSHSLEPHATLIAMLVGYGIRKTGSE